MIDHPPKKVCVFCGTRPHTKTKEHVIPRWLIEHTGQSGNTVGFGRDRRTGRFRFYAYDAFTFPACESCNSKYAKLEAAAKPAILAMLGLHSLRERDLHLILDWFDKVRIGLWLAFYYLDQNAAGIVPQFFINDRLGRHDRLLRVVRLSRGHRELTFRGCDMPAFYYTPSCFSMIINNLHVTNISHPFLLHRRLGFPYPKRSFLQADSLVHHELRLGTGKTETPVFPGLFLFQGTTVAQPMFPHWDRLGKELYQQPYLKTRMLDSRRGIGSVFIERDGRTTRATREASRQWVPQVSYDRLSIHPAVSVETIQLQLAVDDLAPSPDLLPAERREILRGNKAANRSHAEVVIASLKANALEAGMGLAPRIVPTVRRS